MHSKTKDYYLDKFKKEVIDATNGEYICIGAQTVENGKKKLYTIKHVKCGYVYTTTRMRFLKLGRRCPNCNIPKKVTQEEFIEKVKIAANDEYSVEGTYSGTNKKVTFKHKLCGKKFDMTPSHFLIVGERCPFCYGNNKKKTTSEYKEYISNLTNGEFEVLSEYNGRNKEVLYKHNTCGTIFYAKPSNCRKTDKWPVCPKCIHHSYGEEYITKILDSEKINYIYQYRISECKDKRALPFDFAILDNTYSLLFLIEYDGKQHNMNSKNSSCSKYWNDGQKEKIANHDKIKNDYCKKHNIPLLRVNSSNKKEFSDLLHETLNKINGSTTIPRQLRCCNRSRAT